MRIAALPGSARPSALAPLPLWPPILAVRAPGGTSSLHAHHAIHLMVCVEGALRVRRAPRGPWTTSFGVLTAPDVPHAIDARGAEILLVFLDPESAAGSALAKAFDGPFRLLSRPEAKRLRTADPRQLLGADGAAWIDSAVTTLGGAVGPPQKPLPPRVRRVLSLLQEASPGSNTSLTALAEAVGWSPGRLMHAFTGSIGIPLRPYQAWLRLQRAAAAIVAGAALTVAAHDAGFADAAHMARTFRRMLGIAPSALRA